MTLCFSLNTKSFSQSPTLTAANSNPVVGEVINGEAINYTNPGSGGASQTWDFSALVALGAQTFSYVNPSTTVNAASFPSATIATTSAATTTNNYYSTSATDFSIEGYDYGAPTNLTEPYSNAEKVLTYPFTMGSNFMDDYYGTYTSGANTINRTGTNAVAADGYGTLILPWGTLNNVLRVVSVDDYADSTSTGMPFSHFTFNIFNWYYPGVHNAVLSLTSLYMNGDTTTPVAQFGTYLDQVSVGINENVFSKSDFNIYPNPSNEKLFIQSTEKIKSLNCMNSLGQTISVTIENNAINISSLSKGMYFLIVVSENGNSFRKKFIKE